MSILTKQRTSIKSCTVPIAEHSKLAREISSLKTRIEYLESELRKTAEKRITATMDGFNLGLKVVYFDPKHRLNSDSTQDAFKRLEQDLKATQRLLNEYKNTVQ